MIISSRQNSIIKEAASLRLKKNRLASGLHFIEGERLVYEAIASDSAIDKIFVLDSMSDKVNELSFRAKEINAVTPPVMEALCETKTPQWICATVVTGDSNPPERYENGTLIILDNLQDPGNVGTIIRTADAFGCLGVLLSNDCADPYSSKTLRAAMGSVYHLPIYIGDPEQELMKLKKQGFTLICGHLEGSDELPKDHGKRAIVIGNEANGVSSTVADICEKYRIQMKGGAESLNASVAAAIMIYEITKQSG